MILYNIKSKFKDIFEVKIVILLLFIFLSCKQDNTHPEINENSTKIAVNDYLPSSTTNQIVSHDNYILSYSEKHEQAEWVAYILTNNQVYQTNNFKRPFFIEDPKVKTGSAKWYNYKNSGYDKGHLCPAADRSFSEKAYDETFYTSNISPQNHDFNSGIWNKLEQKTRYWATKYKYIYVVSGGVLTDNLTSIGKEKVSVPKYFYKILYTNFEGKNKMIAFLIPNEPSTKPLYDYVVPTDKIELITGLDFFPKLDDKTENQLESNSNYKNWSF
jgi:endonuclease G